MPVSDYMNDVTPQLQYDAPDKPTVMQMRSVLTTFSAASYPAKTLDTMTKNDLMYACRLHGLTVAVAQGV